MASALDLAKLSEAVYDDVVKIGPWIRFGLPHQPKGKSGYKSALYQNMQEDEFAFAIAGTELEAGDLRADAELAAGYTPHQYKDARSAYALVDVVSEAFGRTYLTGHSLGGGLASMLAKEHGDPLVTFNAPGMARAFAHLSRVEPGVSVAKDADRKALHICAQFDVVSRGTGAHMGPKGSVKRIATGATPGALATVGAAVVGILTASPAAGAAVLAGAVALKAHGISRMVRALESRPEYVQDLGWV